MSTVAQSMVDSSCLDVIRETFNFEVQKFPLSGPDGMPTPLYGMFRSDNGKFVGKPCSKKYVPHQTNEVVLLAEAAAEVFENEMDVQCDFGQGHRVIIQPTKAQRLSIYGSEDNIFPRIYLKALYDGHAVQMCLGWYRDMCRNLARAKFLKGTTVSIRHSNLLPSKMQLLVKTVRNLYGKWDEVSQYISKMENVKLDLNEFIVKLYGDPKQSKRGDTVYTNRYNKIEQRVVRERLRSGRKTIAETDGLISGWEAYNAIQGYSQWDQGRHGLAESARVWKAMNDPAVLKAEKIIAGLMA